MSDKPAFRILVLGLSPAHKKWVESALAPTMPTDMPYDMEKLAELSEQFNMIICDQDANNAEMEAIQVLRITFPDTPIYYTSDLKEMDKALCKKNGFTDVFFYPIEGELLKEAHDNALSAYDQAMKSYRTIKLVDLEEDTVLDFSTYLLLPMNKKYVQLNKKGTAVKGQHLEKMNKKDVSSVYIDKKEIDAFYKYTAEKIKSMSNSTGMSATEKNEKVQGAVRGLIGDLFTTTGTISGGKQMIEDCQQIIKNFMPSNDSSSNWYEKLIESKQDGSSLYSHVVDVSTFAALFSMALGIGKPDELALAGLMHDLGLSSLPEDLINKPMSEMTEAELEEFKKHPQRSLDIIKAKKIAVTPAVANMILHHHETYCGDGFPEKLMGVKVSKEIQILGIADAFSEMTSARMGQKTFTPAEALKEILAQCEAEPAKTKFDPELVKKIINAFMPPASAEPTADKAA